MRALLLSTLAFALAGCVLETEACGPDFVSEDGRCVPIDPPPAYYPASADADGGAQPDQGPPPAVLPPAEGYGPYTRVRIIDTTEPDLAAARPGTPGADIDCVLAVGPNDEYGFGVAVVEDTTDDQGGQRRAGDPQAALGEPDAVDDGSTDRFISLGAGGALTLELPFAVFSGLALEIYEMPSAVPESYRVEICRGDTQPPEGCLPVANGLSEITLVRLP